MVNQDRVSELLAYGYECLKNADLAGAESLFNEALRVDFERPETLFALKCSQYWREGLDEATGIQGLLQRGDFIVARWKGFQEFLTRISGDFEVVRYAFKRMAFKTALDFYLSLPDEEKSDLGIEIELRAGRCRKALGDYETAQQHFEQAMRLRKDDARIIAELADCHALSGETRLSKLFFREAFFLGPDQIDLELLESEMIRKIMAKAGETGAEGRELAEWIPVFGELEGVFDVKRELTASESSRLNSSLYQLENDARESAGKARLLKPRLLNRYFWILDHYASANAEKARIDQILLKIRLLDEDIYKQYVS